MNFRNIPIRKPIHHMMIGLFCFLINFPLLAQDEMDLEVVEKEIVYQLEKYREVNSLPLLKRSEELDAVAFDQAEYVAGKGRIVHDQDNKQKESLADRILFYEAMNAEAGENIAMIAPNTKIQIEKGADKVILINEELIVKAALFSWKEEEESLLNLNDPNFLELGIAVHESQKKEVIIVVVMASEAYELPEGVKQKFNFRGVEPYSEEKCKSYMEKFSTSPELFSDAFSIEGNIMYFSYHNKKLIEDLLESSSDGLSAELVCDWQFECGKSNQLFPGEVVNGYMMPIMRRGAVANTNLSEKEGELKLRIGEVPEPYLNNACEINGMIIKDNSKCASIPFNKFEVENLRWLDLPFQMVKSADSSLSWKDSLQLKFYAKLIYALDSEIIENSKLIKQLGFEIEDINIEVSLAPTVNPKIFSGFEYELLDALRLDSSKLGPNNFSEKVAWDTYEAFSANTFYELETREMNKEAKVDYLNETRTSDPKLDNFLDSLSYMKVGIYGNVNLDQEMSLKQQKALFNFAMKQEKYELALHLFNMLAENEQMKTKDLVELSSSIEQTKDQLSMINNLIVRLTEEGADMYDGNSISTAFLELHLVDGSNSTIRYNYLVGRLNDWAERRTKVSSPKEWEGSMSKIRTKLDPILYAKVMLNFEMLMADHYYDQGKADLREKSFKNLMNWLPKAQLDDQTLYDMAKYLAYQDQSSRAIETLMPIVKSDKPSKDHLFYFLQLARYDEEMVPQKLYMDIIEKTASMYPKDFCELFSKKKMGKQPLEDYAIKSLYCDSCAN